jgi:hypothetical protein
VLHHQAAHGGSVIIEIIFAALGGLGFVHIEALHDEKRHALMDLRKHVAVRGIQRVVEVEKPCGGFGKRHGGRLHD